MKLLTVTAAFIALTVSGGAFQVEKAHAADPWELIVQDVLHENCAMAAQRHPGQIPGPGMEGTRDTAEAAKLPGAERMLPPPGRDGDENMQAHEIMPPDPLRATFMKFLALSDAQKKKIFLVILDQGEKASALMKKRADLELMLRKAEHAPSLDEKAVRSITAQIGDNEADMIISRASGRRRIREILTPEQREMVKKMEAVESGPKPLPPAGH